jgi:hypothetical protein
MLLTFFAAPLVLAGTRMRFRSDAAARHAGAGNVQRARHGAGCACSGCGAPSGVQLEAALGACRERALELELRVRELERRLGAQARVHFSQRGAQKGLLLREAGYSDTHTPMERACFFGFFWWCPGKAAHALCGLCWLMRRAAAACLRVSRGR